MKIKQLKMSAMAIEEEAKVNVIINKIPRVQRAKRRSTRK
jgi:hypothetical protein